VRWGRTSWLHVYQIDTNHSAMSMIKSIYSLEADLDLLPRIALMSLAARQPTWRSRLILHLLHNNPSRLQFQLNLHIAT
jgi:hypothetical protein